MKRGKAALLSFGLVLSASAAFAQSQTEVRTGSRFLQPKPAEISEARMSPVDQARETAVQFGECVARANRPAALRTVQYFPTEPDAGKALSRIAMPDCLRSGELRMPLAAMRGALFIGLYRLDYGRTAPPSLPPSKIDFAQDIATRDDAANGAIAVREFIDCVVRADPADARTAILAPVASKVEALAYAGLSPHLNACLSQGVQIKFSKTILSGLIAEVAYRNAGASIRTSAN